MFARDDDYPTSVAFDDEDGFDAAIEWCVEQMTDSDVITIWTPLKSNLDGRDDLAEFVRRHSDVEHITGRGRGMPKGTGPVLMAWPDLDDIAQLTRFGRGIRALCVLTGNPEEIHPWVAGADRAVLGDESVWARRSPNISPVVVEALRGLTATINHNNTISAGYEKEQVVGVLLALHDAGIAMDADAMQGWALAHGWSGKNPGRLADYVRDISAGKRPRARRVIRSDYVDTLRDRAHTTADDSEG